MTIGGGRRARQLRTIRTRGRFRSGLLAALTAGWTAGLLGVTATAMATTPASLTADVPADEVVSQATASAMTVRVGGRPVGTGTYTVVHDGDKLHTDGRNGSNVWSPDGRYDVAGGVLAQDATADAEGTSMACSGLVEQSGIIQVGDESCLDGEGGHIRLSLGTLPDLGLGDQLDKLPLPTDQKLELPDAELQIRGRAVAAQCTATPEGTTGRSLPLEAELVAVVDGTVIPIVDLPADGGTIELGDLLDQLPGKLPAELRTLLEQILDQLPDGLPDNPLLTITTDEQIEDNGRLHVTALRIEAGPPTLLDVHVGSVSCGPNAEPVVEQPEPTPEPSPEPDPTAVPTAVPAGAAGTETSGDDPGGSGTAGLVAFVVALIAFAVGGGIHRNRRTPEK